MSQLSPPTEVDPPVWRRPIQSGRSAAGAGYPPKSYATFMMPPYVTNSPQISVRVLPNDEDFNEYYEDPSAPDPCGNERLTFEVLYEKVLRTYYLLYPAMNGIFSLRDPEALADPHIARPFSTAPKPPPG